MKILVKNSTILDPSSPYHGQVLDILIDGDQVIQIGEGIETKGARVIDQEGLFISPGWVEMHSNFSEPGFEEREDLISGSDAAAAGGFTSVVLMPSVDPVMDSRADIDYVYNQAEHLPVNLYPVGALSKGMAGAELSEMFDMQQSGAVAFSDDQAPVTNPNLLKLALLYTRNLNTPVMVRPFQPEVAGNGQVNEGETSTYLGLKGIPDLAEELMIARDLYLLDYTGGTIHFCGVSTKKGLDLIRNAKEKGASVTCDVNLYNLLYDEGELNEYDTNFKVQPPLRDRATIDALIEGVIDGTVDAIAVDHIPMDEERKNCEFEHASFGMAGLETAFGKYRTKLSDRIDLDTFIRTISINPRQILDLPRVSVKEGSVAEFTLFQPKGRTQVTRANQRSKAVNDPGYNQEFDGRVYGVINGSRVTVF